MKIKELELILSILEESRDRRSGMGCEDAYDNEAGLFTEDDELQMRRAVHGDAYADMSMSSADYVWYAILQVRKSIERQRAMDKFTDEHIERLIAEDARRNQTGTESR
jgi:hypothetical protein